VANGVPASTISDVNMVFSSGLPGLSMSSILRV
jgi:hypothetical protein